MSLLDRKSLRIVHIDNFEDFLAITGIYLNSAGFKQQIVHFDHPGRGIEYLKPIDAGHAPHVILLDLDMPRINGFEVLHWIRNSYVDHDVPVLILTSSDDEADRRRAELAGATRYLLKNSIYSSLARELDHIIAFHKHNRMQQICRMREPFCELALMAEYTDEMVVLSDGTGKVEWVNDPFIKTCGYTLNEVRGKKLGPILQGPGSCPADIHKLHEAIHGVHSCECSLINYRKNGMPYPVYVSLGPIWKDGELEGFLAIEREMNRETRVSLCQNPVATLFSA